MVGNYIYKILFCVQQKKKFIFEWHEGEDNDDRIY